MGLPASLITGPSAKTLYFDSYAELRDWFRALVYAENVHAVVILPNGGNFSSGGDVHDIIGPLTKMSMKELLNFTRMTGDLVKAMINCGKPIIAAVDGVCAGAGAIMAMASDLRLATPEAKTAFLFNRVGLAGCDMGACAILPRIIGQTRAADLLFTGRAMSADEGLDGFYNKIVEQGARKCCTGARRPYHSGPDFANSMTKTMLAQEWSMSLEQAIEAEAQAQAICMQGQDFHRAYNAFVAKENLSLWGTNARSKLSKLALFEENHRAWAANVQHVAATLSIDHSDPDAACRALVSDLGANGILAPTSSDDQSFDVRKLCLAREILAYHDGLADFSFAMQGLEQGQSRSLAAKRKIGMACQNTQGRGHFRLCPDRARSDQTSHIPP